MGRKSKSAKLTDISVKNAEARDKEYLLHDGQQRNLYLRVKPNGTKLWRCEYRILGKPLKMPLGSYPEVSLKLARTNAAAAQYEASQGRDPKALLQEKQKAVLEVSGQRSEVEATEENALELLTSESPFRTLALAWFNHWKVRKATNHVKKTRNRLTDNLFPVLGTLPISKIEAPDIVKMAKSVEKRVGRATSMAQRSIETASQIMRFGIAHGVLRRNPVSDIKPSDVLLPTVTKNQARVEEAELPKLLVAIDEYRGHRGRLIVRYAAQLMVLVFLRTAELLETPWAEIDLKNRVWRVPGARMKLIRGESRENMPPHLIPLATQTIELLEKIKKLSEKDNPFLFPGEFSATGHIHKNSLLEMLARVGFKGIQTGHGFRGIASTILHERGHRDEAIELQLAHMKRSKVGRAYDYAKYLDERRKIMQAWADYIDDALRRGYESRKGLVSQAAAD